MQNEKTLKRKAQKALQDMGYAMHKSRAKNWSINNQLGYMIVNVRENSVVRGSDYDLSLDDVLDFAGVTD